MSKNAIESNKDNKVYQPKNPNAINDNGILKMRLNEECEFCFRFQDTPFAYTLSLINGKYKMSILYTLNRFELVRYNELKRFLDGVSFKTLTAALRELERDNLIIRKEYPQIPPKVEYRLSPRGKSLMPILDSLCEWGKENIADNKIKNN